MSERLAPSGCPSCDGHYCPFEFCPHLPIFENCQGGSEYDHCSITPRHNHMAAPIIRKAVIIG